MRQGEDRHRKQRKATSGIQISMVNLGSSITSIRTDGETSKDEVLGNKAELQAQVDEIKKQQSEVSRTASVKSFGDEEFVPDYMKIRNWCFPNEASESGATLADVKLWRSEAFARGGRAFGRRPPRSRANWPADCEASSLQLSHGAAPRLWTPPSPHLAEARPPFVSWRPPTSLSPTTAP